MQLAIDATACTERSMPPIMMTNVSPVAMRNRPPVQGKVRTTPRIFQK